MVLMMTTRFFGKCRACKSAVVVESTPRVLISQAVVLGGGPQQSFMIQPFELVAQLPGYFACRCGGSVKNWQRLQARISDKHVCGAKCLNSKGPSCECSCGGANHGSGHLAAAA